MWFRQTYYLFYIKKNYILKKCCNYMLNYLNFTAMDLIALVGSFLILLYLIALGTKISPRYIKDK